MVAYHAAVQHASVATFGRPFWAVPLLALKVALALTCVAIACPHQSTVGIKRADYGTNARPAAESLNSGFTHNETSGVSPRAGVDRALVPLAFLIMRRAKRIEFVAEACTDSVFGLVMIDQ
jgi:hypothetical protein